MRLIILGANLKVIGVDGALIERRRQSGGGCTQNSRYGIPMHYFGPPVGSPLTSLIPCALLRTSERSPTTYY